MKLSSFIIRHQAKNGDLYLFSTYTGNIVRVCKEKVERLDEVLSCTNQSKNLPVLNALEDMRFLIDEHIDEYQVVTGEKVIRDTRNNYLELIVLPTEKCNFRCIYCYENFQKGEMSLQTQDALVRFVKRELPSHKGLAVSWFGGEPLLALEIIKSLSRKFINVCKELKKPYRASITTNGYLLDRCTFDLLYSLRVLHYQITIDGSKDIHDQQRVLANGGPTFQAIIDNLKDIKSHSHGRLWTISIRTNVTSNIMNQIENFKHEVLDPFRHDNRFYIMLRQMWTNNTQEADCIVCDNNSFDSFVEKCDISSESLYQDYIFSNNANFICYASSPNSFVVGSDGCLYKCTYALYDEINQIGQILPDGGTRIDDRKLSYWVSPRTSHMDECFKCTSYATCLAKGCPYKQNQSCDQNTLPVMSLYIPSFFDIAPNKADLSDLL